MVRTRPLRKMTAPIGGSNLGLSSARRSDWLGAAILCPVLYRVNESRTVVRTAVGRRLGTTGRAAGRGLLAGPRGPLRDDAAGRPRGRRDHGRGPGRG